MFHLGEPVLIKGHTKKVREYAAKKYYNGNQYPSINNPPLFNDAWGRAHRLDRGIIVGKRTVVDGSIDEGGFRPHAGTARTVWLVAFDLRRRPVMCHPEQITKLSDLLDISDTST